MSQYGKTALDASFRVFYQQREKRAARRNLEKRRKGREASVVSTERHRARERGLSATLTVGEWRACIAHFGRRCAYCGRPIDIMEHNNKRGRLIMDHVVPVSRGGGTDANNVVCACRKCNFQKWCRSPRDERLWHSGFTIETKHRILGWIGGEFAPEIPLQLPIVHLRREGASLCRRDGETAPRTMLHRVTCADCLAMLDEENREHWRSRLKYNPDVVTGRPWTQEEIEEAVAANGGREDIWWPPRRLRAPKSKED